MSFPQTKSTRSLTKSTKELALRAQRTPVVATEANFVTSIRLSPNNRTGRKRLYLLNRNQERQLDSVKRKKPGFVQAEMDGICNYLVCNNLWKWMKCELIGICGESTSPTTVCGRIEDRVHTYALPSWNGPNSLDPCRLSMQRTPFGVVVDSAYICLR